jgi:predicted MFS family arabinose efflux permease
VLPQEREYTKALSLSRLAYDLESLVSPMLAAALLTVMSFHWLFGGTAVGFVGSACLVLSTVLPQPKAEVRQRGIHERTTRGIRIYLATPRLRGLLALNLSVAAAGAMVIVNTVVYVQSVLGMRAGDVAVALASFGGGSMLAALLLPSLLNQLPDRPVMLAGATLLAATMLFMGAQSLHGVVSWELLLAVWFVLGLGYSAVLTPSGRLLRRSSHQHDRPALFAAQFALSHASWLLTYPLAGWLGAEAGMATTFVVLGGLTTLGAVLAPIFWPANDPHVLEHVHKDLSSDHPHVHDAIEIRSGLKHAHAFFIDDFHRKWPE